MNNDKQFLRTHIITNNIKDKIEFTLKQEKFFFDKYAKNLNNEKIIDNLQISWTNIFEAKSKLLDYVKRNYLDEITLSRFKILFVKIYDFLIKIEGELEILESERNFELEEFHFDLKEKLKTPESREKNALLPNYLEITKTFNDLILKRSKQDESNKNPFPDYCDLGVMVVIKETITYDKGIFLFNKLEFETPGKLEKHLHFNNLCKTKSIRQYLAPSLGSQTEKGKNLFRPDRVKKIIKYCEHNNIEIPTSLKQNKDY